VELCASRELAEIQAALKQRGREATVTVAKAEPEVWRRARAQWEKPPQTAWTFGELPPRVKVSEQAGVPVEAWPALTVEAGGVALRLARTPEEAQAATARGLAALLESQVRYELGWLERDLKALRELGALLATLVPLADLQAHALGSIRAWICDSKRVSALTTAGFEAALNRAKADLRGLVPRYVDQLREILTLRLALEVHATPYAGMAGELAALVSSDFVRTTPYAQLAQFPRYLKAMKQRADRWRQNPAKDAERARQLAPYVAEVGKLRGREDGAAFRWLAGVGGEVGSLARGRGSDRRRRSQDRRSGEGGGVEADGGADGDGENSGQEERSAQEFRRAGQADPTVGSRKNGLSVKANLSLPTKETKKQVSPIG
jgi:ATP-dependent helicase HrpA